MPPCCIAAVEAPEEIPLERIFQITSDTIRKSCRRAALCIYEPFMYGKNKSCRTQVTPMKKQPQLTLDVLRGMMDVHYTLAWTDCRDNLRGNLDLVRRCLKEGSADPLREAVSEWYSDIRAEAVSEILEKLETICVERGFPQADVRYFFEPTKRNSATRFTVATNPILSGSCSTIRMPFRCVWRCFRISIVSTPTGSNLRTDTATRIPISAI